jgi:hypothetical protein
MSAGPGDAIYPATVCIPEGHHVMGLDPYINAGKAPLVLGVTGHRKLRPEDYSILEERVAQVIQSLRKEFPSTPFILLSPLAEGADRLVAEVALRMNVQLVVPLPMSIALYEHDFPNSIAQFHELLGKARTYFEVSRDYVPHAVATNPKARDLRYEAVGKYIVRQCQILLALWDGVPSNKVGATATVVHFQTQGIPEQLVDSLETPERFPVYHVVTPRENEPTPEDAFSIRRIYPKVFRLGETPHGNSHHESGEDEARDYFERLFGNLERFNRQVAAGGDSLAKEALKNREWLVGGLWGIFLTQEEETCLNRYAIADALAIRFQKEVRHTHRVLQWSVLLAFFFFVAYAHIECHPWGLLPSSFAVLLFGYYTQRRARQRELDNMSQDYRAIAEGCRVAFFWHMSGIDDSVSDNYLARQRTELDWIRTALRGWDIDFMNKNPASPAVEKVRLRFVLRHWVGGQLDYFTDTAGKQQSKLIAMELKVSRLLKSALWLAGILLAVSVLVRVSHFEWWSCSKCEPWFFTVFILGIDMLLAAGALMHHSIQRQALSQHNKQYQRTKEIFRNAARLVRETLPVNVQDTKKRLLELGQSALEENGDWVMLHRDRPLELPHP